MAKTLTDIGNVEAGASTAQRRKSAGVLFIAVKNLLFWGSVCLTLYGAYALVAHWAG